MVDITDDQFTCLMITAKGDSLAPIGRWKEAVLSLASHGLLEKLDDVNYGITPAGRAACEARDKEDDEPFRQMIETHNKVVTAKQLIKREIEKSAAILASIAQASSLVTGDAASYAAKKWSAQILERSLEMLSKPTFEADSEGPLLAEELKDG